MTTTLKHKEPGGNLATRFSKKIGQVLCFGLAFCLLSFAGAVPRPVLAQAATTVSFSPASAVIDTRVGSTTVVDVVVSNAVNIGAFTIQIDYDPSVARISQWASGNFFTDVLCFAPVEIPGTLELACTKLGTPGNNGSGTLAKLTFEAIAWGGNTTLNLSNAQLVELNDELTTFDALVEHGELRVIPYHLALPLILKQGSPLTYLVPDETLAQASALRTAREFSLALPGCDEAQS